MLGFEVVSDWIKHAFVAKFNHVDASAYDRRRRNTLGEVSVSTETLAASSREVRFDRFSRRRTAGVALVPQSRSRESARARSLTGAGTARTRSASRATS